ncbi:MAG: secretin N-terminal domain-containing protein, partial [Candidatus Baltobacteraceae bacterium]
MVDITYCGIRNALWTVLILASFASVLPTGANAARALPQPSPIAQVVQLQFIPLGNAAAIIHQTLPRVRVQTDVRSNSLVLFGSPDDVQSARSILQGVDVKNPTRPTVEVIQLRTMKPADLIARIHPLYPDAQMTRASKTSIMLRATALDNAEIKALISSLDVPLESPAPTAPLPVEDVDIKQGRPKDVARAIAR